MLPDAPSICRIHLDFMKWADDRMMAAIQTLPEEAIHKVHGVAFESIAGTALHIYSADEVWFRRVNGEPSLQLSEVPAPAFAELAELLPAMHEKWRRWALELNSEGWFQSILSRNAAGVESRLPHWQILLHLVNHGSYHRGQVMSMIRQSGGACPATDLIAYYRALAAK